MLHTKTSKLEGSCPNRRILQREKQLSLRACEAISRGLPWHVFLYNSSPNTSFSLAAGGLLHAKT